MMVERSNILNVFFFGSDIWQKWTENFQRYDLDEQISETSAGLNSLLSDKKKEANNLKKHMEARYLRVADDYQTISIDR